MENKRKLGWIHTYTHRQFWPLNPRLEDVCIEDIAHSLSNLCRYNGHCKRFYSVAEHCVYVSSYVKSSYSMIGLLHDAAEAYLTDFPAPIKISFPEYDQMEKRVLQVIFDYFNIHQKNIPKNVKVIDKAILADESEQIMGRGKFEDWNLTESPLGIKIHCWSPIEAENKFLNRYYNLEKELKNGKAI